MAIYLGLGTNLGDREMNLIQARDLLMKEGVLVLGQSEVRETEPLGGLEQPLYLNQVVEVQTDLEPIELLRVCKLVEKEMGREDTVVPPVGNLSFGGPARKGPESWKSRIIDVDLLMYHDLTMQTPELQLPHPGNRERDFVMAGIRDLDPGFQ